MIAGQVLSQLIDTFHRMDVWTLLEIDIDSLKGAAAPVAAPAPPAPPRLRFVFMEEAQRNPSNEFFDRLKTAENTEENKGLPATIRH